MQSNRWYYFRSTLSYERGGRNWEVSRLGKKKKGITVYTRTKTHNIKIVFSPDGWMYVYVKYYEGYKPFSVYTLVFEAKLSSLQIREELPF
jgi:hypothetical protein